MEGKVIVSRSGRILAGTILAMMMAGGVGLLAQTLPTKEVLTPQIPSDQQRLQETTGPGGETKTDAVLSNLHAIRLPSALFSEMEQWQSPKYPMPFPQVPQTPQTFPPIQLSPTPQPTPDPKAPPAREVTPGPFREQGGTDLGPPSWAKPGVRLTYYAASATVPGEHTMIVEDGHGDLIGSSGRKYREVDVVGASGQGYVEIHLCYVDRQTAALDIRSYGKDIASGAVTILATALGHLGPAHTGGEYWIHPELLMQIQQRLSPGQKILRMPYQLDGRTYNALRIQTQTSNGFAYHTYDLNTGILISAGGSAVGGSIPVLRGDKIYHGGGGGSTYIGLMRFKSMRQLNLPWIGGPMPDWVAKTRSLIYQGTKTANVTAAGNYSFPITAKLVFQQTGPGWLKYIQQAAMVGPSGMPPSEGQSERVVGTSQVGGLWIPPSALRQLRPGQVLDEDRFTYMRLSVQGVDGSGVHLTEEGPRASRAYAYNLQNGMLMSYSDSKKLDMVTETNSLTLRGRE